MSESMAAPTDWEQDDRSSDRSEYSLEGTEVYWFLLKLLAAVSITAFGFYFLVAWGIGSYELSKCTKCQDVISEAATTAISCNQVGSGRLDCGGAVANLNSKIQVAVKPLRLNGVDVKTHVWANNGDTTATIIVSAVDWEWFPRLLRWCGFVK